MKNILVTGATGNVGIEIIKFLSRRKKSTYNIVAGVRDVAKGKRTLRDYEDIDFIQFDFEDTSTFEKALEQAQRVFLLRPPHLADVEKYFKPLVLQMKSSEVSEVVFLSVQGAEKSAVIPHNKIEKLIKEVKLNYVFLRPSYFMQNLTTTLIRDIQEKREIVLPAGKAKFNWVDAENIGEVGAILLENFEDYQNQALEITGYENKDFYEVTDVINQTLQNPIEYKSVNPFRFYFIKKKEGVPTAKIFVMVFLHFLPRFQKPPQISDLYEQLTGKKPTTVAAFVQREQNLLK